MADRGRSSSLSVDVDAELSILEMGVKFSYRVPSFSVLHVELRQIKLQLTTEESFVRASFSMVLYELILQLKQSARPSH